MTSPPFKGVRAYFLAAWPTGYAGTDLSLPMVFFDECEARSALVAHQHAIRDRMEADLIPRDVYRSTVWYLQTACVQGIVDHPWFTPLHRAPGQWVSAYSSQEEPGIYRAFAGGFYDFQHVVHWEPFILAFQRLVAAMHGDGSHKDESEAVDSADEEVVWDSLQLVPIASEWMGQAT